MGELVGTQIVYVPASRLHASERASMATIAASGVGEMAIAVFGCILVLGRRR